MRTIECNGRSFISPQILVITDILPIFLDPKGCLIQASGTNQHERVIARAFFSSILKVYQPGIMEVKFGEIRPNGMEVISPDDILWDTQFHMVTNKDCKIDWDYQKGHIPKGRTDPYPVLYIMSYQNSDEKFKDHWSLLNAQIRALKLSPYGPDVDAIYIDGTGKKGMSLRKMNLRRCRAQIQVEGIADVSNKFRQRPSNAYDLADCFKELGGLVVNVFRTTKGFVEALIRNPVFGTAK